MFLSSVVIDARTLQRGSEAQHVEWDANIRQLLSESQGRGGEERTLQISMTEQRFVLDFHAMDGRESRTITIAHELLSKHITEYVDIVRQIADSNGVNQLEALDMAKKVTHDRVARVLKRELRDFDCDLETCRRLFTLLLSLRVDTTRLIGIHGHRTIR